MLKWSLGASIILILMAVLRSQYSLTSPSGFALKSRRSPRANWCTDPVRPTLLAMAAKFRVIRLRGRDQSERWSYRAIAIG